MPTYELLWLDENGHTLDEDPETNVWDDEKHAMRVIGLRIRQTPRKIPQDAWGFRLVLYYPQREAVIEQLLEEDRDS